VCNDLWYSGVFRTVDVRFGDDCWSYECRRMMREKGVPAVLFLLF
jgi:hypothetical protein